MRRRTNPVGTIGITILAALLAVGGAAGDPGAPARGNGKIDPRLAGQAAARPAASGALHVIVFGRAPGRAIARHAKLKHELHLVGAAAATVRPERLENLANDRDVSFVALDAPVGPDGLAPPSESISSSSLSTMYPARVKATNAWGAGYTGAGVGIAVIDSGAAPTLDLGTRLVQVRLDGQDGDLTDTNGHGTLVAGVAAGRSQDGRFIGVAPGATVYAININRLEGPRSSDVITALKWVFDNARRYNIRVVNLSLSERAESSYLHNPLNLAVERLWASGVFVVVSAGNRGAGGVNYAPANDPLAMSVGAYDMMGTSGPGDDTVTSWSSSGKTVDGIAKPELLGPGRRIQSVLFPGTYLYLQAPLVNRLAPGYGAASGTSFAAPQVAGAAAIVFQAHPDWSPDNVKWVLLAKAGAKVRGSSVPTLDLGSAYNYAGTPDRANKSVKALVCAPGSKCTSDGTVASAWDSSSWNASSWDTGDWTASSWNASSWDTAADWSASSWDASSWNASSWDSTDWTSVIWD